MKLSVNNMVLITEVNKIIKNYLHIVPWINLQEELDESVSIKIRGQLTRNANNVILNNTLRFIMSGVFNENIY